MTIDRAINLIILLKARLRKKLTEDEQIALRLAVDVLIDKMDELVGKDINVPAMDDEITVDDFDRSGEEWR